MKKISLLLIIFCPFISFSQSEFQVELNLGYTFQGEIEFDNQEIEETGAFGMRFGFNYLYYFNNKFFLETGMFGKYNRGQVEIETLEITYNSLRGQVPLYAGYVINDMWKFNIGASIENNKDFDEIDFKSDNNLRYDLLTKIIYSYNTRLEFSFYTNWMINDIPDFSTFSNPKNGLYLGVIYKLKTKD